MKKLSYGLTELLDELHDKYEEPPEITREEFKKIIFPNKLKEYDEFLSNLVKDNENVDYKDSIQFHIKVIEKNINYIQEKEEYDKTKKLYDKLIEYYEGIKLRIMFDRSSILDIIDKIKQDEIKLNIETYKRIRTNVHECLMVIRYLEREFHRLELIVSSIVEKKNAEIKHDISEDEILRFSQTLVNKKKDAIIQIKELLEMMTTKLEVIESMAKDGKVIDSVDGFINLYKNDKIPLLNKMLTDIKKLDYDLADAYSENLDKLITEIKRQLTLIDMDMDIITYEKKTFLSQFEEHKKTLINLRPPVESYKGLAANNSNGRITGLEANNGLPNGSSANNGNRRNGLNGPENRIKARENRLKKGRSFTKKLYNGISGTYGSIKKRIGYVN
jgi:DNA polymerase III gamma/tau subunit